MHIGGKIKCGFYPLPWAEAMRIRNLLAFPSAAFSALDPCIGDGTAFGRITSDSKALRYGIELDAYRAEQARGVAETVIQGSCFDVHCPVDSLSLLYLNPPYDFEVGEGQSRRMEPVFLEFTCRWLKPGGVLILVIPAERIVECGRILAFQFGDVRIYRLTKPECVRYRQIVVFGVRRTRRARERMQEGEIRYARHCLSELSRNASQLPPLPPGPDCRYVVPESEPVTLIYRGLPLDEIEDVLLKSPAYRQVSRLLFGRQAKVTGQPLTPLHGGHVDTIRLIADFPCKLTGIGLLSMWRHSIGKMFRRTCSCYLLASPLLWV